MKRLDSQYGNFKLLAQAAENPEAIGTLANRAFRARGGASEDFVELLRAYQRVLLRGYPQSSGTAENLGGAGIMGIFPPPIPTVRAMGTKASAMGENVSNAVRSRLPSGLPMPSMGGAVPFIAGQQTPGVFVEEMDKSF